MKLYLIKNDKNIEIDLNQLVLKKRTYFFNNKKILRDDVITFICEKCNKIVHKKWFTFKINFNFLCQKCLTEDSFIKQYGVKNPFQSEIIKEKIKKNNLKKYGVQYTSQVESIKQKIKLVNLKKYGNEFPQRTNQVKEKAKKTNLERYGTTSSAQNKNIRNKIITTNLKKYGNEFPQRTNEVKEKIRKTNLKRYGVNYLFQDKKIREKFKRIKLKKYGDENYSNREKAKKTNLEKYGFESPNKNKKIGKKISNTTKIKRFNQIINRVKHIVIPLFSISEYDTIHNSNKYSWECKKCNTKFEDDLYAGKMPRCPICFPKLSGTSQYEKEISEWIKTLDIKIEENNKSIISPLELDVFLPEHNLAIEFNGLYWHSELQGKDSNYHLNKTSFCEEKSIRLIHIYEDEWIDKKEIIKSIIRSKLGIYGQIIYARKCEIREISNNDFYEKNHIQGNINSKINLGLYYKKELVSMLGFSKPRFNKKYDFEITRFCNKLNTKVIGSFGKLFSYFKNKYNGSIITYSDKRYFDGAIYKNNDFQQLEDTKSNYYYTDYKHRFSRLKFQKHKIPNVDTLLTEWQNMQLQGWDRIWDCGNYRFEYIR